MVNYPVPSNLSDTLNRFKRRIEALEFRPQWAASESRMTVTATITIPDAVKWVWVQASGPVTLTLPDALDGKTLALRNFNAVAVTLTPGDGSLIDGAASITFSTTPLKYIQSDGTVWLSL
jgi:hypothetical protein